MARYLAPYANISRHLFSIIARVFISFINFHRKSQAMEKRETRGLNPVLDISKPVLPVFKRRSDLYSNVYIISGQIEIGYFFVVFRIIIDGKWVCSGSMANWIFGRSALFCDVSFKIMRRDKYIKIAYLS